MQSSESTLQSAQIRTDERSSHDGLITNATYGQLRQRLTKLISAKEDDIRFYELCRSCQAARKGMGRGKPQPRQEHVVV